MKNELQAITIKTPIANVALITQYNNECISAEFDTIRNSENKIVMDVSTDVVNARNSKITNLTVNELNIVDSTGSGVNLTQFINNVVNDNINGISPMKYAAAYIPETKSVNESDEITLYGASQTAEIPEYDMSSFFSSTPKGIVKNLTVDELYHVKLYRVIEGLKIPLYVGTSVVGEKLRLVVYHDHVLFGQKRKVDRVYVPVVNGADKKSVVQYAGAETVTLS